MQGKWIKPVLAMLAVPVVATGAYQMVRAYEAGTTFQPGQSGRELQVNQVIFSGDEDISAQKNGEEQNGESELWEKDKTAEDSLSPELKNSADYLFQTGRRNLPDNSNGETVNLAGEEAGNNSFLPEEGTQGSSNSNGYVYDVTGDTDNADLVIAGGNGQNGGTGENGSADGSGNGDGQGTTIPADGTKPSEPDVPVPTPAPPLPRPTGRPADTVRDPETKKDLPNDTIFDFSDYDEDTVPDNLLVYIQPSNVSKDNGSYLHQGQTVTEKDLFNTLDTYVVHAQTGSWDAYAWGTEHYGKYVKIVGVSFDGGATWTSDYPVTIPIGLYSGQMVIRVAYRFHISDPWTTANQKDVTYEPAESRVYALTEKLTQNLQTIDTEKIANPYNQYPEPGSTMNLYSYQSALLGKTGTELTQLFPGWTENGQAVSWLYPVEAGRHILEPMDMVEIPEGFNVRMINEYLPEDYLESVIPYPLQTLTSYYGSEEPLEIPEYIQAVDPDSWIMADTIQLPSTVVYVDTDGVIAWNAFAVDDRNPCLSAGSDGVLYNKAKTQILTIPYITEEITVSSGVEKVAIPVLNSLQTIRLEATASAQLPEINLENADGCAVSMKDAVLNEFADRYENELEGHSLKTYDSGLTYTVKEHIVLDETGRVRYALKSAPATLRLAKTVESIGEEAFSAAKTVNLVIPESITTLTLEKDCLKGSSIKVIWCYNEAQKQMLEAQVKQAGAGASGISVRIINEQKVTTKLGYTYIVTEPEGIIQLAEVPDTLTYFDGTVKADDGTEVVVTSIGEGTFKNHTQLQWVMLPQSIKSIGADSFRGCTALQGVLIDSRDEFTIGNNAFVGCSSIRFVAANAPAIRTEDDYAPVFKDEQGSSVFYIPSDYSDDPECFWNQNPNADCTYFESWVGLKEYSLESIGTGGKMLYGVSNNDIPFIALRSGKIVDQQVVLPKTTTEIFNCAMYGTNSSAGSYTVNWGDLALEAIDEYAFYDSGLTGSVSFGPDGKYSYLMQHAFDKCGGITEITMGGTVEYIGEGCFANCTNLTNVTLGQFDPFSVQAALHSGMFFGCTKIPKLILQGSVPPQLAVPTRGATFRMLGYETDPEQERGMLVVPEGTEQSYLDAWKYIVLGYSNDEELDDAARNAAFGGEIDYDPDAIAAWKAEQIEKGQRLICSWLDIEYTGTAEEMAGVSEEQTKSVVTDGMTVSGGDAASSVSDGNALPQASEAGTPEEKDSTQEETVQ